MPVPLSQQIVPGATGNFYPGVPSNLSEHSTWDLKVLAAGRGLDAESYGEDRSALITAIQGTT